MNPGEDARLDLGRRGRVWQVGGCTVREVGAVHGGDAYLLDTGERSALVDCGFAFCEEELLAAVRCALDGRAPDLLLLTHSHYDHAGAAGYLRAAFPDMQVVAHAHTARVLARTSALETMRRLDDAAARTHGQTPCARPVEPVPVDRIVAEGDIVRLGAFDLQVMEAPGHTRDCLAFWCPQERFLVGCETMGVPDGDRLVEPTYLVGYQAAMDHIARCRALQPAAILIPHTGVVRGEEARAFLEDAELWARRVKDRICEQHRAGLSDAEVVASLKELLFTERVDEGQPEAAFDLNASYLVPMVIRECLGEQAGTGASPLGDHAVPPRHRMV